MDVKIIAVPFSWNDNLGEEAQECYDEIRPNLSYSQAMILGMAIAKLKLLEEKGVQLEERVQEAVDKIVEAKEKVGK